jgi:hypothetical protein
MPNAKYAQDMLQTSNKCPQKWPSNVLHRWSQGRNLVTCLTDIVQHAPKFADRTGRALLKCPDADKCRQASWCDINTIPPKNVSFHSLTLIFEPWTKRRGRCLNCNDILFIIVRKLIGIGYWVLGIGNDGCKQCIQNIGLNSNNVKCQ